MRDKDKERADRRGKDQESSHPRVIWRKERQDGSPGTRDTLGYGSAKMSTWVLKCANMNL